MAEYIEREAAIESLPVAWDSAINALRNAPSADVAPVVHGRWLCVDTDTEQFFLCNRCKKKEFWESNYCPNCGAKMDGDSYAKES